MFQLDCVKQNCWLCVSFRSCQDKNASCCVVWMKITFLKWTNFEFVCFNWIVWNKIVCHVFLFTQQFSISSGMWIIQPNTFTKVFRQVFQLTSVCYIWNQRVLKMLCCVYAYGKYLKNLCGYLFLCINQNICSNYVSSITVTQF